MYVLMHWRSTVSANVYSITDLRCLLTVFGDVLVNVEGCDYISGDGEGGLLVGREVVHDARGPAVQGGPA